MDTLQCLVQDTSEVPIPSRTPDKGQDVFKELSDKVSTQLPAQCFVQAAALQRVGASLEQVGASLEKRVISLCTMHAAASREPLAE